MSWDIWAIFFVLAVVLPWRGRIRVRRLMAMPQVTTMDRLAFYASTIAFQWAATAIVAWRAWAHGFTLRGLALVIPHPGQVAFATVIGALLIGSLQWMNLRRVGRLKISARGFLQIVAQRILPQSAVEQLPYFALATTAGLCEEFLYRGFAMEVLRRVGLGTWLVVAVSAALFALAHLYQGRGGLVSTLFIGAVFGCARIAYDSLIPVVAWHVTLDAIAGVAGPRYLVRRSDEPVGS